MADDDIRLNVVVNGEEQLKELATSVRNLIAANVTLARNTKAMDARQRAVSQAFGVTSKGMNEHAKSLKEVRSNQRILAQESIRLSQDIKRVNASVKKFTKDGNKPAAVQAKETAKQFRAMKRSLDSIRPKALTNDLRSLSLAIKKAGKDAQFVGRSLIIGLTTPIIGFANRGIDAFKAFDREMIRLEKIAGDVIKSYDDFGNTVFDLSSKFGVSRDLIVAVTADFAELGIATEDALVGLTDVTNQVAVLGTMDVSDSQGLVQTMFLGTIRSMDLMGRTFESAAEKQEAALASVTQQMYVFNAVENNTALSFRDMAIAIPEASAATVAFGITMTQTAALLAPMKAAGIDVSTAANGLKVSLQRLVTPTGVLKDEMARLLNVFSDSADVLEPAFEMIVGTGMSSIQGLIDATKELRAEASDETVLQFYSKLFQKRQATRMLTSIDSLISFQDELFNSTSRGTQGVRDFVDELNGAIKAANELTGATVPMVSNVESFTYVARIGNAQVGDMIEGVGEVTAEQIRAANMARDAVRKYVKDFEGDMEIVDQISSQAGKALFVELLGASYAQEVATQELDIALQSASKALDRAKIAFKNIAVSILGAAEPAFKKLGDVMTNIAKRFEEMSDGAKIAIIAIGGAVAAIGPLVFITGQMQLAFGVVSGTLLKFVPSVAKLTAESLAAAPAMLRLNSAVMMNGDAFTTSAGRFSRYIATVASGDGVMAKMADRFGRMTGILSKDITAGADVKAAVMDPTTAAGERFKNKVQEAANTIVIGAETAEKSLKGGSEEAKDDLIQGGVIAGNSIKSAAAQAKMDLMLARGAATPKPLSGSAPIGPTPITPRYGFSEPEGLLPVPEPVGRKKKFIEEGLRAKGLHDPTKLKGGQHAQRNRVIKQLEQDYDDAVKQRRSILAKNNRIMKKHNARMAKIQALDVQNQHLSQQADKRIATQKIKSAKAARKIAARDEIYAKSGISRVGAKLKMGGRELTSAQANRIAMGGVRGRLTQTGVGIRGALSDRASQVGSIFRGTEAERAIMRQAQIDNKILGAKPQSLTKTRLGAVKGAAKSGVGKVAGATGISAAAAGVKDLNKQAAILGTKGPGPIKKFAMYFGEIGKKVGKLGGLIPKVFGFIGKIPIIGPLSRMLFFFTKIGKVLKVLKIGFAIFTGGLLVGAIGALVPYIVAVVKNFDKFKTAIGFGAGADGEHIGAFKTLMDTLGTLKGIIDALIQPFKDFFAALSGGSSEADKVQTVANAFGTVVEFVKNAADTVKSFVDNTVVPFMRKAFGAILTIVDGFKGIVKAGIDMKNGVAGAGERMKDALKTVGMGILQFFLGTVAPGLIGVFATIVKKLFSLLLSLVENSPIIAMKLLELFVKMSPAILKVIKFMVVNAIKLFAGLVEGAGMVVNKIIHLFTDMVRAVLDNLSFFGWIIEKLGGEKILDGMDSIGNIIEGVGEGAADGIRAAADLVGVGLDTLIGVAENIDTSGFAEIGESMKASIVSGLEGKREDFNSFIDNVRDSAQEALQQFEPTPIAERFGESLNKTAADEIDPDEIFEPTIESSNEAGAAAGENFADKFNDALKSLKQKFVDLVGDFMGDEISNVVSGLTDALEDQRDSALSVFDEQIDVLKKLEKAEESLTKEREYQSNMRKLQDERELNRQNYVRNRALAIYEGRIDDARMLDRQEQKSKMDSAAQISDLEQKRNEDLRKENLNFLKDSIKDAKKQADEFFKEQIAAFKEASKDITKFAPQTIEDYEEQLTSLTALATQFSQDNATEFAKTFDEMQTKITTEMPNKTVGVFGENLDTLINTAKDKYGLNDNSAGIIGATVGLLQSMGDAFDPETEEGKKINTNFDSILQGLKDEITSTADDGIKSVIENKGPQAVLEAAIINAETTILNEWKGTVGHIMSEVDGLANMMDPMIENVLEAQLAFEALEEAAKSAGSAASSAGSAAGGASGGASSGGGGGGGGAGGGGGVAKVVPQAILASYEQQARQWAKTHFGPIAGAPITAVTSAILEFKKKTYFDGSTNGIIEAMNTVRNGITNATVSSAFTNYVQQKHPNALATYGGVYANGGRVPKFAMGGYAVPGFRSQGFPALLHGGEYVINSKAVSNIGLAALQAMNNMRFAAPGRFGGGQNVTTINKTETVNIYVENFIGEDEWFNSMVSKYDMRIQPVKDKKFNMEDRFYTTYKGASY